MTSPSGHRLAVHTADIRIQAWAPSREQCVAEAVAAMVESFADIPKREPSTRSEFDIPAGPADDMLVAVLDEVIYTLDTSGRIPVSAHVTGHDGGLRVRLELVDTDCAGLIGPVPKAVTLHGLEFASSERGWSCQVVLDV